MTKLLLPLIALLAIVSCKKEEAKSCYKCTTKVTISDRGGYGASTRTVCDMTESEINKYQQGGTSTIPVRRELDTAIQESRTWCVKQ